MSTCYAAAVNTKGSQCLKSKATLTKPRRCESIARNRIPRYVALLNFALHVLPATRHWCLRTSVRQNPKARSRGLFVSSGRESIDHVWHPTQPKAGSPKNSVSTRRMNVVPWRAKQELNRTASCLATLRKRGSGLQIQRSRPRTDGLLVTCRKYASPMGCPLSPTFH
jgi:hypothetical protein